MKHPLFATKTRNYHFPFVAKWANRFLSTGSACYYISRKDLKTRLYLHNYFSLLSGHPFGALWRLEAFSMDGKKVRKMEGNFNGQETVIIELEELVQPLGEVGLCLVHIDPQEKSVSLKNTFFTIFFAEFYNDKTNASIHSFGHLTPKLYQAHDCFTASFNPQATANLLLSNSMDRVFRTPSALIKNGPMIEIKNHRGERRKLGLPVLPPLSCVSIEFKQLWPDSSDFVEDKTAFVELRGLNILYAPLFLEVFPSGAIMMEHFQGLEWEGLS